MEYFCAIGAGVMDYVVIHFSFFFSFVVVVLFLGVGMMEFIMGGVVV